VDPVTLNTLRSAERSVTRLVEECIKGGALYAESPQAVAQVSRTGKWLLNAITSLRAALNETCAADGKRST
jgi:hypothetical protein